MKCKEYNNYNFIKHKFQNISKFKRFLTTTLLSISLILTNSFGNLTTTLTKFSSKGFMSKKISTTKSLDQEVIGSSINSNNIIIHATNDINLQSSNLITNSSNSINKHKPSDDIQLNSSSDKSAHPQTDPNNSTISITSDKGSINLLSTSYTNYYDTKTSKSSFGGLSKSSSFINDTTTSQSSSNLFSTNTINLKANNINLISSTIKSNTIDIDTNKLNLISSKNTNSHTEFKTNSGLITATIHDKGKITQVEVPSIIEVNNKFILNGKDITNKLDTKTYKDISNSLNSNEFKESVLNQAVKLSNNSTNSKEKLSNLNTNNTYVLSLNSITPLNQKEINQIKATLNSKEWDEKTTTLSGIGSLITTAVVTYLTAGAGSAISSSLGTSSFATTNAVITSVSSAVISNTSLQAANMIVSNGKVSFDIDSLAKSALSAGLGAYASSYINSIDTLTNSNIINTSYLDISYADTLNTLSNSAIQSQIHGTKFKDTLLANISTNIGNYLFKQAGDIGLVSNSKDGSISKTLMHSLVGGSINTIKGDSFKDGALISGITETLRPLSKDLNKNEQLLTSQIIGILSGSIINSNDGANLGFNLASSSEIYNRQLHKDEIEWLEKSSNEFKSYYETQTNRSITDEEARDLLHTAGKYIVDVNDNAKFNILNFFDKADFSKDEINTATNFIFKNSAKMKFTDLYKEEFTPTDFFSATDEQFYNNSYNPNSPQGLNDVNLVFIPSAKVGGSGVGVFGKGSKGVLEKPLGSVSKRDELLNSVQNDKLKNAVNQIYRPNAKIGDGGLADALRHEFKTGELVGGKSHIQKANERIKNLKNIIKKENLNSSDLKIAEDMISDMDNALRGK